MNRFCHYQLRTTDIAAARAFYGTFVDHPLDIVALPEPARAAGAPAHWLGHIGVDDVAATAEAFVARGAVRLGPQRADLAVLRDPGGAVIALAPPRPCPVPMWARAQRHERRARRPIYVELLGWVPDGPDATIVDVAGRPEVHTHWCFFFVVDDFDTALGAARAAGAKVLGLTPLPDGRPVAVCDDPQGAAFGLMGGLPTS